VFSLHHDDEEDSAFVAAAEPAHSPIIDLIAKRHRLAKPKELGLNVHGSGLIRDCFRVDDGWSRACVGHFPQLRLGTVCLIASDLGCSQQ
jgi:hypothetical protein